MNPYQFSNFVMQLVEDKKWTESILRIVDTLLSKQNTKALFVALKREGFGQICLKYGSNQGIKDEFGFDLEEEEKLEQARKEEQEKLKQQIQSEKEQQAKEKQEESKEVKDSPMADIQAPPSLKDLDSKMQGIVEDLDEGILNPSDLGMESRSLALITKSIDEQ